jgi:hypothetical protein
MAVGIHSRDVFQLLKGHNIDNIYTKIENISFHNMFGGINFAPSKTS